MKKLFSFRVWILIFVLFLSLLAINPNPWASGVEISSVRAGSLAAEQGLKTGEIIKKINGYEIETLADYKKVTGDLEIKPFNVKVETDKGIFNYNITTNIGFEVDENLTVIKSDVDPIEKYMEIKAINDDPIESTDEFYNLTDKLIKKQKLIIDTDKGSYAYLSAGPPEITVRKAKTSNIVKGLELEGGTRVLIRPISEEKITEKNINDLIAVMSNRLNVYGLADLKIRSASDLAGNKFVLIEIAGATREEVKELVGKQGKFEAKIGDDVVFIGGERDIPYVCKDDGSCSGVINCDQTGDRWQCVFQFSIKLSTGAAKKHAIVTDRLEANNTIGDRKYLSKKLDLYLDDKLVDSLLIGEDLKGKETTDIAVSGPGFGNTQEAAIEDAVKNMNNLQTILITGSLPFKIEIVKLDTISPILGKQFIKNTFLVGLLAILAVALVLFIRYRSLKLIIPIIITCLSEVIIILGFAGLSQWNLDIVAIAGIIAAVGTGVDDQIIMIDEIMAGKERYFNWKQRIKRAFFIIFASYATTVASMIPLWNAGAGLLRGFAVITIVGVTIGVFITRPAFATIAERLYNK